MALQSNSLVLRDPSPCEVLQSQLDLAVRPLKNELDLFFVYEQRIDRGPGVVVHVWWEPENPDLDVRLICDDVIWTRYINVTGPNAEQRRRILEYLAKHFTAVTLDELRGDVRRSGDERAWLRLALATGADFDEPTFDLVCNGLTSDNVERRRGAAQAAGILQWSQLTSCLRDALMCEMNTDVRALLEIAIREAQDVPGPS